MALRAEHCRGGGGTFPASICDSKCLRVRPGSSGPMNPRRDPRSAEHSWE